MAFPQHGFMFQQLHEDISPDQLPSCLPPHPFNASCIRIMNLQLEANHKIILHFFASDRKTGPSEKHCIDIEQKTPRQKQRFSHFASSSSSCVCDSLSNYLEEMGKGPGLYTDIGKKAKDLLYKDHNSDQKFSITTQSPAGVGITSSGTKKGDSLLGDVSLQLKQKNITTDLKVSTDNTVLITATVDEAAPGLKSIFSFRAPDQNSGKIELQYLHEYAGISTSMGLTQNPTVNFSAVMGTNVLAAGTDVSFDTKSGNFTKINAGLSFTKDDLVASLTLNDKGDSVNASYYHIVNPLFNTAVGAEVNHKFSTNVNTITVGTQHSLDPLTTVKARVNSAGIANALIQHQWTPSSFFTISGEVDTKAIDKNAKVGLALSLKP
ncbi:unnamed protein product [Brassica napus]|nr:unnamed protein product [Brassica napus]